ncbi:MAG: M23 family metallopeptidase [Desulfobacteraceae bacterium]|nr:M23 family metallopeptidase [Desulfobacteraceae bacterium]
MKKVVIVILFLAILIPLVWILFYKYEGSGPKVDVVLPSLYLKKSYEMSLKVNDKGTGLRKVMVSIVQNGNEKVLLEKDYPPSSLASFFSDRRVNEDSFVIPVESRKYGMHDGEALIRIMVADYSWRGWNRGNVFSEEKKVIIDTKPPEIRVLTRQHNIARGGSGLVIYKLSEDNVKSGVMVGDNFFPGYSGLFKNKNIYAAFFALSDKQGPGTQIFVTAQDLAGNVAQRGFHHYIGDKHFKTDTLNISDKFLEFKMPDFDLGEVDDTFVGSKNPLLEKFIYINTKLRKKNCATVLKVPEDTEGKLLWKGRFARLAGSATRAGFADHRTYKYHGREIGQADHMGMDLASTSNAKVGAANAGRVIMAKKVGIFGNCVIIDHGFGLASLYAHLSEITVNKGDEVAKGDVIGISGLTGLAGGDHLHFSMIVHNVFVNPVEWWDASWIKNNITSKIKFVKQMVE